MVRGSRQRLLRALASAVLLLVAGSVWQAAVPPGVAAAQTDLTFTSNSTWNVDPGAGRVHVLASVTATSHTSDSDGRRYYYDQLQLTLPEGATGFGATSLGQSLGIDVLSTTSSGVILVVALGQRLYSGQSGWFSLSFDLVDPGGSTDRDLRFGRNLMSFPVSAFGSPGQPGSSVTVVFPSSFTVQEEFGGLARVATGSSDIVFASGVIDDSTTLNAWFTAVQPVPASGFSVRLISVGPLQVVLRYWADDPGWADQVERVLRAGYPVLRDLIGLGDPIRTTLSVEEATSQQLGDFSGAYDQTNGKVSISYFADPFVIVHEAAHMWFNSTLSSERWVNEGFASYYAQQTIDKLGLTGHGPVLTDQLRRAAVPFNDWTGVAVPSSATDGYLYGASLDVARQIAAIAGQDGLRSVWAAARSGLAAYQPISGPRDEILADGGLDWRRLLDLLEQTTGRSFVSIWRGWVVNSTQASLLEQRRATLDVYAQALTAAGSWNLPPDIRRSLDNWDFDQATALMAQARTTLNQYGQIVAQAALEKTTPPPSLQRTFETGGTAAASLEAANELAVLDELASARRASSEDNGVTRAVGLIGTDPEANLVAARAAFSSGDLAKAMSLASAARLSWQSASTAGQFRVLGGICVFIGLLILLLVFVWTRGGKFQPGPGIAGGEAAPVPEATALTMTPVWKATSAQDGAPAATKNSKS
jgi:hypothetical protein